ncbi:PIN domain-containing protein [Nocardia sp. NPDC019304]|uniref:PIN domain-containing protein n=1 Tax=Nocardia sp. NPDC019304 TaxID=3154485 RepID=UPI0034018E87
MNSEATSPEGSARRLASYQLAQRVQPLEVDETVAEHWALLIARLRSAGRKVPINDCWIAATALAHDIPMVTQDGDYEAMPDLTVRKL